MIVFICCLDKLSLKGVKSIYVSAICCFYDESFNQKAALSLQDKSVRKVGLFLFRIRYKQNHSNMRKSWCLGKSFRAKKKKKCGERRQQRGSKEINWDGSRVLVWFFLTTSFNSTTEANNDWKVLLKIYCCLNTVGNNAESEHFWIPIWPLLGEQLRLCNLGPDILWG